MALARESMDAVAMEALLQQALRWPPEQLAKKRLRRLSSSPDIETVAMFSACASKLLMQLCWSSQSISDFLALMEEMDSFFVEEVKLQAVAAMGEALSLMDFDDKPEVQLCTGICELVVAGWMCPDGVVAALDELLAVSRQLQDAQHSSRWPHTLALLESLAEAVGSELLLKCLVKSGPNILAEVPRLDKSEARQRIPLLSRLVTPGSWSGFAGKAGRTPASRTEADDPVAAHGSGSKGSRGSSGSSRSSSSQSRSSSNSGNSSNSSNISSRAGEGDTHGEAIRLPRLPDSHRGQLGLEAVEQFSSGEGHVEAYALLPIWLPPATGLGPPHSGLLLGGRGEVVEEWDLEAGSRIDRFEIGDSEVGAAGSAASSAGSAAATAAAVVSMLSPEATYADAGSPEVESLVVAVVQGPASAGMAVLRRSKDPDAPHVNPNSGAHLEGPWQVEVPWNSRGSDHQAKRLGRVSRGSFLHNSGTLVLLGQQPQIGSNEIGLYDLGAGGPFELATFTRHADFVTDVSCLSTHTFASTSFDGKALLWDIRAGHDAVGNISGGVPKLALGTIPNTQAGAAQVLTGDLQGGLELLDLRKLARPLAVGNLSPAASAVVRITTAPYQESSDSKCGRRRVVAAVATAEGLTSLSLQGDKEGRRGQLRASSTVLLPALVTFKSKAATVSTRCYDIAAPKRISNTMLGACGAGGVTRFRLRNLGLG